MATSILAFHVNQSSDCLYCAAGRGRGRAAAKKQPEGESESDECSQSPESPEAKVGSPAASTPEDINTGEADRAGSSAAAERPETLLEELLSLPILECDGLAADADPAGVSLCARSLFRKCI